MPRVKYLSRKVRDLSEFPNFSASGSIKGMKEKYYGKNALLVRQAVISIMSAARRGYTTGWHTKGGESEMLIRREVIEKWEEINAELNRINKHLTETYGGPDIRESDAPELFTKRRLLVAEMRGMEKAMSEDELDIVD